MSNSVLTIFERCTGVVVILMLLAELVVLRAMTTEEEVLPIVGTLNLLLSVLLQLLK